MTLWWLLRRSTLGSSSLVKVFGAHKPMTTTTTTTTVERLDMTQKAKSPPSVDWSYKQRLNISLLCCCRGGRQAGRGSHTVTTGKPGRKSETKATHLTRVGRHVHFLSGSDRDCSTGGQKQTNKQTHAVTVSTLHKFLCFFLFFQPDNHQVEVSWDALLFVFKSHTNLRKTNLHI